MPLTSINLSKVNFLNANDDPVDSLIYSLELSSGTIQNMRSVHAIFFLCRFSKKPAVELDKAGETGEITRCQSQVFAYFTQLLELKSVNDGFAKTSE